MSNLPCPICGRPSDHKIEGKCRECFIKTVTLAQIPGVIHGVICPRCGAIKKGERWTEADIEIENAITDVIKRELIMHPDAQDIQISVEFAGRNPSIFHGNVCVTADIEGIEVQSLLNTEVRISRETCNSCSRRAGGYYEAVIQIRADSRFPDEEEQEKVMELIDEVVYRQHLGGDKLAFISKVEKLHEGTDVFIGSNGTAKQICRTAAERFGCKYSKSPSLAGRKNGRDIYRITYSLRLPRFVPGDIIRMGDATALIRQSGRRTSGMYLESGLEFQEHTDRLKDAIKIGDVKDGISAVLLSVENDSVQIMHPRTYRPMTLQRPAFQSKKGGEEITIVILGDDIFILPPERDDT